MRPISRFRGGVVLLACLGLLLPQVTAAAAQPQPCSQAAAQPFRIVDVALGPQGSLHGAVLDAHGITVPSTGVVLLRGAGLVGMTETDAQGRFAFRGLPGGVYGVGAGGPVQVCRLWAPGTAPPAAIPGLLILSESQVVRQSRSYDWVSERPLLTYALITAAIVVPVTVIAGACDEGPRS